MLEALLHYLLPGSCLLCAQACGQQRVCDECALELPHIRGGCRQCGLPGNSPAGFGNARLCAECLRHPPAWDHAIAALVYEYPVDHLVRNFKFHKDLACGQLLAEELVRAVEDQRTPAPDAPARPDLRHCQRGFNQAELLAEELHQVCGIRLERRLLRRTHATPAQSGLDRKSRQRNLKGAFSCAPLTGQHIALIDDVLTTGATLQECSRVLKQAGASQVSVWVAARVPAPGQ
jgi:ComF family protein